MYRTYPGSNYQHFSVKPIPALLLLVHDPATNLSCRMNSLPCQLTTYLATKVREHNGRASRDGDLPRPQSGSILHVSRCLHLTPFALGITIQFGNDVFDFVIWTSSRRSKNQQGKSVTCQTRRRFTRAARTWAGGNSAPMVPG